MQLLFALIATVFWVATAQAADVCDTTTMPTGSFCDAIIKNGFARISGDGTISSAGALAITGVQGKAWATPTTSNTIPLYNGTSVIWTGGPTLTTLALATSLTLNGSGSGTTVVQAAAAASGTLTLPAATDTITGKATTDIFTNKTFNTASTGNVFQVASNTISAISGAGASVLLGTSPVVTTDARPASDGGADLGTSALRWGTVFANVHTASGQAARIWGMARNVTAATAGLGLTLNAGGAVSGGSNLAGGDLLLTGGISTGTGKSNVSIQVYPGTAGATSDNTPFSAISATPTGITLRGPDDSTVFTFANTASTSRLLMNITSAGGWQFYDNGSGVSLGLSQLAGVVTANATTVSSSKTTGALISAGGLGVAGKTFTDTLNIATVANASTTAALCWNSGTGLVTENGAVGTCTVSTLAAKNLTAPLTPREGFDIVMAMEPWRYTLKEGLPTYRPGENIGFVAEYALQKEPRLVAVSGEHVDGFLYEQYTAALTGAIKHLSARIDHLESLR